MFASPYKLIITVATAAALLITSAVMAKTPTGGTRPGQTTTHNGKGSTTTTAPSQNTIARVNKEQQLKADRELREKLHEQGLKKEQMLKDKNSGSGFTITQGGGNLPKEPGNNPGSGSGFTITHGGGNLPKEPGNNPDKGWDLNWNHDCHKHDCYDYHCSWPSYGSYDTCVEPMNTYVVLPGDTLASISMKVFGNPTDSANIAMFNRMPMNAALAPGQVLMLPSMGNTL